MFLRRTVNNEIVLERDGGLFRLPVASMSALLQHRLDDIRTMLESELPAADDAASLPPIDGRTEVWASGVTYQRSRVARMGESADPDIYDRVYTAERPELFFKSPAWRTVTDGEEIGIRQDSSWNVPEPELAVIANRFGEIVAYGVCDDVSSRALEGENPLYLPQAKVYAGACAVGARLRPAWEVDPRALTIRLMIERAGARLVEAETTTADIVRDFAELVSFLYRADHFPDGAWLSTGTGIVPSDDFTLADGDRVTIRIDEVGEREVVARD
ncbi:MAG: fumarylacetoacetate hydrolase, partial [Microbacterium sp.]